MSLLSFYPRSFLLSIPLCLGVQLLQADVAVSVSIDPTVGRAAISPYIYGTNQDLSGVVTTVRRQGGNRMTGYNWENNASNAGSDFNQSSDNFLTFAGGIPAAQENVPGIVATHFHDQSLAAGTPYSIITLPMAGFVSADKNGTVATNEAAPSVRWKAVQNTKPTAFTTTPNTSDGTVYTDEFLNLLVGRYGSASSATGIKGYNLDNEPDLWSSTHPRLHPTQPTCVEIVARTIDTAKTVKRIDPAAETLGFVSYGFNGYLSFQNATDWNTEKTKGPYLWFVDYFLDQLNKSSTTAGKRLLDVLDVHNYSENTGGGLRVNSPSTWENIDCNKARIQSPRSFWDPSFVENSWVGSFFSSFLPFIPRLQSSIATFNPGTKLAITEYDFGGEGHISGGLAQADILGIFGKQGVYLASWWQLHNNPTYIAAAFKLFLNYNGSGGKFGSTKVNASTTDNANCSVYGSIEDSSAGKLHLIVLNKNYDQPSNVTVQIAGPTNYTSARVFAFDSSSATITERTPITTITGNRFTYALPLLTAAHLVLTAGTSTPIAPTLTTQPTSVSVNIGGSATFTVVASGTATLTYQWRKNGAAISNATSPSLTLSNAQTSDAATYSVVVNNAAGSVTSAGAVLTVVSTVATVYPAEAATRSGTGTILETRNAGFHGTAYINFPANSGILTLNNINGGTGGARTLRIRFALGATPARTGQLVVNGVSTPITFSPTGAWSTWTTLDVTASLLSGSANTVQLKSTGSDLANIDELTVL